MQTYNVSRETFDKLKTYEASLKEWQNKFNLVSNASLSNAWERHFEDSARLFKYIPQTAQNLIDFGSGAGFPGLVIAIMAQELMPNLKVTLVESIKKKTVYLNTVQNLCGLDTDIINDRIENISPVKADVITSRAMCNLNDLLKYASRFATRKTTMIFPKGKSYESELEIARKNWKFDCRIVEQDSADGGVVLIINNLFALKGVK